MLFALLYNFDDQVIAAAPACDQIALGDRYWVECHSARVAADEVFATAYREIRSRDLQQRLLNLGVDDDIRMDQITKEIDALDFGGIQQSTSRAA